MSILANDNTGEFRFPLLLATLFGAVLIPPYFDGHPWFNVIWKGVFSFVLIAAAYSVIGHRRVLLLAVLLLVPTIGTVWLDYFNQSSHLVFYLDNLTTIAFLGFISYQFLLHILRERRVTLNIIVASMCVYLMLALIWAAIYSNINLYFQGAFHFPHAEALDARSQLMGQFSYYSFVTLSTLGYGDIVPVHKVAQAWAVVEAMIGQFYIAIIMARLVGLHVVPVKKD